MIGGLLALWLGPWLAGLGLVWLTPEMVTPVACLLGALGALAVVVDRRAAHAAHADRAVVWRGFDALSWRAGDADSTSGAR